MRYSLTTAALAFAICSIAAPVANGGDYGSLSGTGAAGASGNSYGSTEVSPSGSAGVGANIGGSGSGS
ncbi:hypothetical protein KCU64_g11531, partial [Aureobasidium melanogenum]